MNMTSIGQRIKLAREQAHITQKGLAEQIGFSVHHVSAIERGSKTPKLETFVEIARAVGVSADWLLQDELAGPEDAVCADVTAAMANMPADARRYALRVVRALAEEGKL